MLDERERAETMWLTERVCLCMCVSVGDFWNRAQNRSFVAIYSTNIYIYILYIKIIRIVYTNDRQQKFNVICAPALWPGNKAKTTRCCKSNNKNNSNNYSKWKAESFRNTLGPSTTSSQWHWRVTTVILCMSVGGIEASEEEVFGGLGNLGIRTSYT